MADWDEAFGLVPRLEDRLRFVQEEDRWYVCSDTDHYWSPEERSGTTGLIAAEWTTMTGNFPNASKVGNVRSLLKPLLAARPEDFDAQRHLLGTADQAVDLRTGRGRPVEPAHLLTRQATVPWAGLDTPAPRWEDQLRVMFRVAEPLDSPTDPDLVSGLQLAVGAALSGAAPHLLVILHGPPQNGKGTFTRVLARVLGDHAAEVSERALFGREDSHSTELTAFWGRRLVVAQDLSAVGRLNLGRLKRLTGGDKVVARRMRQDVAEVDPTHVLFLTCNRLPDVGRDSFAPIRERVRPFRCGPTLPHRVVGHEDSLYEEEGPGILAWAVRGVLAWRARGDVPLTAEQEARVDEWEARDDPLAAWFAERCEVGEGYSCSQAAWKQSLTAWWVANRTERNLPPTPEVDEWLSERGHPSLDRRWPDGSKGRRRLGFQVRQEQGSLHG